MGSEWAERSWGDLATLEYGRALRGHEVNTGPFRVFGTNGPIGWHSEALCPHPGVIIGRKGAYRGVHYSPAPFFVIDTAFYLKPKVQIDLRWAYYNLLAQDINSLDSGSAIPSTSRESFYSLPVQVPSLPEQCAIAHILGTLDDKIELNRKMSETLEEMARELFKAWFVDFEPVRAKMEGRWQRGDVGATGRSPLPGLPAHLYDLFPDRLIDSELGEIPEGWELTSLSEFSSLNPESWTKRTRPEEILYVDLSNTKWGRVESVTKYQAADAPSRAQRVLRPLDTIVGTVRPGNGSYALIYDDDLTGSTGFAVLRPLRREYSEFVYLSATARENIERLSNLADGGAYPAVRPEIVSATQVPRAGEELINEFSRQVSSMLAGIASNERTSRTLAALRDTLLPKLISGELRVKDAETFLERVAA